jgi:hypothetical protein
MIGGDALGFLSVRVADLWNSDVAAELRQAMTPEGSVGELKYLETLGLTTNASRRMRSTAGTASRS